MKKINALIMLVTFFLCLIITSKYSGANRSRNVMDLFGNNYSDTSINSQITLTGTVKNQQGLPLQLVKISAGNAIITSTDSTGAFHFTMDNKPTVLIFSLDKMATVKRSYHPSMLEKSFNIIMEKDSCKYCARISEAIHKKN